MRAGDDLILLPARGETVFTDNGKACDEPDIAHCVGYALLGFSAPANAFVRGDILL